MRTACLLLLCLLVAGAGIAGCRRDDAAAGKADATNGALAATANSGATATAPGDDPAPPAGEPTGAANLGDFRVVSVLLGDALDAEHIVRSARSDFDAAATIHASVLSVGAHPGLTLAARWRAPDGHAILETGQPLAATADSEDAPAATATTFTLRGDAPWPAGDYALELRANGRLLQRVPFSVR